MWPRSLKYLLVVLHRKHLLTPALPPKQDLVCLPARGALQGWETFEGSKRCSQDNLDHSERDFQSCTTLLSSKVKLVMQCDLSEGAQVSFLGISFSDDSVEDYDKNINQITYSLRQLSALTQERCQI